MDTRHDGAPRQSQVGRSDDQRRKLKSVRQRAVLGSAPFPHIPAPLLLSVFVVCERERES